jgi:hypothetical protein
MSNANYCASAITQRRQNKAIAGSFINRIQNGSQSTTSYGPLAGNFDQSIMNAVHEGQMKQYSKIAGTCTTVDPGCLCVGAPAIELGPCPLNFYWATNIVGNGNAQSGKSIAVGVCGNVYVTGIFTSPTITVNSYQSSTGSGNQINTQSFGTLTRDSTAESAYVVKYDVSGQAQWAARLTGSSGTSTVLTYSLAIDSDENVYVTGEYGPGSVTIYSSNGISFANLPATAAGYDAFVVKYNSAGIAQWATTITGPGEQRGNGIAVDSNANVYITGYYEGNPITVNSYDGISGSGTIQVQPFGTLPTTGSNSAFVVKYDTNGIVDWATYIDGPFHQEGFSIAVDNLGYAYVTGKYLPGAGVTTFYDFLPSLIPTPSGTFSGGNDYDAFVAKYKTTGPGKGTVQWATNMTGTGPGTGTTIAAGLGIAADTSGNVYVTGAFYSATLAINSYDTSAGPPTPSNPFATTPYGTLAKTVSPPPTVTYDVFLIKFATDGTALWATSVGGGNNEGFVIDSQRAAAVAVDSNTNVYLTGFSRSTNAIIQSYDISQTSPSGGAISLSPYGDLVNPGKADVFIVKYNTNGVVQWATNIGGIQDDGLLGADIALDPNANVHVISNYTYNTTNPGDLAITFNNFTGAPSPLGSAIGIQAYGTFNVPSTGPIGTSDVFIVKYNTNGQIV